jgi:hypothetical protein
MQKEYSFFYQHLAAANRHHKGALILQDGPLSSGRHQCCCLGQGRDRGNHRQQASCAWIGQIVAADNGRIGSSLHVRLEQ